MWKKIIYFSAAIIFGIVFYIGTNATNLNDYKLNLVNTAIQNEDYHIIPQLFLEVPFDTKSIINDNDDDAEVKVYPASGMTNYILVDGESKKEYIRYENAYLFFIFKINFPTAGYIDSGNNNINNSAIRFVGDKGEYDFYFVQNEQYNAGHYIAEPKTEAEYSINCARDLNSINDGWSFMPLSLSATTIKAIEEKTGKISSFKLVDATGEIKMEENISFDFDEDYFSHEYIVKNRESIDSKLKTYYSLSDSNEKSALADEINKELEDFRNNFEENTKDTGFAVALPKEITEPGSIYWKTVAQMGLYFVFVVVLYFLFFHLRQIKEFVKGLANRNNKPQKKTGPYIVKKDPVKPVQPKSEEKEIIEHKVETANEETKTE